MPLLLDPLPSAPTHFPGVGSYGGGSRITVAPPVTMMVSNQIHTPVLLERSLELLTPALREPKAVVLDATLGMAGHAAAILERFPEVTLIGLDRDSEALQLAQERLRLFGDRAVLVQTVYDTIAETLGELGIGAVQGILFDLGVSSLQLDRVDRGFSYARDAPLDMRMDQSESLTAATILAEYSEVDLRRIFTEYGEEKLAARYARAIVAERGRQPILRTEQLVSLLHETTPVALQRAGHPAKRVFQALRIEVNQELAALERAIPAALASLDIGGRIVVMSYQSLEDRLVKRALQAGAQSTSPLGLPVELPEHAPELRLLLRGAELASPAEIAANPRSTPVRLRAAERIRAAR